MKRSSGSVLGFLRGSAGARRHPIGAALALLVVVAVALGALPVLAAPAPQDGKHLWDHVPGSPAATRNGQPALVKPREFRSFELDGSGMQGLLRTAPLEGELEDDEGLVLSLPTPERGFARFAVQESPLMEPALAAKHPDIKTYSGVGIDDPASTIRADVGPLGFHASVRGPDGTWYIDPYYHLDQSLYVSYYGRDLDEDHNAPFVEHGEEGIIGIETQVDILTSEMTSDATTEGETTQLRIYRLALLSDPTYANFYGPENVTAAKVTLMSRVNQIYEDETAIRMILIAENDALNLDTPAEMTGANGPCGAAGCFTSGQASGCSGGTLNRNRIVIGQLVGASSYDIGHIIFGLSGGGVAGLGVVGGDGKARGCTGLPIPGGDRFAVDYVAHEMGHQYAASHTFNGNQLNCSGGNRSAANSVEPGSGSSIMAYAGICRQDDLQSNTDPYFSQRSFQQITTYVTGTRPAINEVQTASLRGFNIDGDSFRVMFEGQTSEPIVRGANYTTAGIKAAIESMPGWPAGGIVTLASWGGTGGFNDNGFQVTFGGTLAQTDVSMLELVDVDGASGYVGETARGGPIDNQGWEVIDTGNSPPVVEPLQSYTIPYRTPFRLTGKASDPDGDTLTYMWEQNNPGASSVALVNPIKTTGPLFRQFGTALDRTLYDPTVLFSPGLNAVTTDPTRVFPDMLQILAGNTNATTGDCPAAPAPPPPTSGGSNVPPDLVDCYSEFLPTGVYPGPMNFRLTVRDGNPGAGGVASQDTTVSLATGTGPFLVTSHSTDAPLTGGSTQTVTWDVAGTDLAPIETDNVRIRLSIDGGFTYPYMLAPSTPNDGSQRVMLPNVSADAARIMVEAVGNIFFDVNDADLVINAAPVVTTMPAALTVRQGTSPSPSLTITAHDQDSPGSALSAQAVGLPAGLALAVTSTSPDSTLPGARGWQLVGQVTAPPGTYDVTVTVTDGAGGSGSTTFRIVVRR